MIKLKITASGFMGRIKKGTAGDHVKKQAKNAVEEAVSEWVTRSASPGLGDRFETSAFATHQLTRRSPSYVKLQKWANGVAPPYRSPRKFTWARLALALSRADKANPLEIIRATAQLKRAYTTPMRQLVTRPGGYRVTAAINSTIKATLTLPGARVLNKGGAKNAVYRKELLDLNKGGGRDRSFIIARIHELLHQRVWAGNDSGGLSGLQRALRRLA